jgi:DNA-binding beta-propeller fold protein YncE
MQVLCFSLPRPIHYRLVGALWTVLFWISLSILPSAMASPIAVVANGGGSSTAGSVTIVDLGASTIVPITITDPSFNKPRWVAIAPNNRFAVVGNGNGNSLSWLDLTTSPPSVLGTTIVGTEGTVGSLPGRPRGIVMDNALAIVAVDDPEDDDAIVTIDISCLPDCDLLTPGNQPPGPTNVFPPLSLGKDKNPDGIAITPDGSFLLVTETKGSALAYVDLAMQTLLGVTPLGTAQPFDVAVSPNGETAVVTNRQSNTVSILDVACLPDCDSVVDGNQPPAAATSTVPLSTPRGVAISPDGNAAIIAQGLNPGQASVLHFSDLTIDVANLAPAKTAFGVTTYEQASGARRALITNEDSNSVSIVDLDVLPPAVLSTFSSGIAPRGIALAKPRLPKAKMKVNPKNGKGPLLVEFDASGSLDPDGTIVSFTLDFGDSSAPETITSGAPVFTHTYPAVLQQTKFTARLTVVDNDGYNATGKASILTRPNRPPLANFVAKTQVGSRNVVFSDRSRDVDGTIVAWHWNFADGGTSTVQSPSHTYAAPGKYSVSLTVTDENGASSIVERKATVR